MFHTTKTMCEGASAELLGGKGYGVMKMSNMGIRVPLAVIFPTSVCRDYMKNPAATMKKVVKALPEIKKLFVETFGYMPLVSVRSGAKMSMPGMMDTILNVGLDDTTFSFWEEKLGADCTLNSFSRLIEMYSDVVMGYDRHEFAGLTKAEADKAYQSRNGMTFPDADTQLVNSIEAVFKSWGNDRAKVYRKLNNISEDLGTAVTIQAMVFGNMGETSCTGVLFSRNPSNGADEVMGEFLVNAQGEDVVAGTRTPTPLSKLADWNPVVAEELLAIVDKLEKANKDMQDVEFTVQDGKLYILQTRNAKRTAQAALRIALDLVKEEVLTPAEAVGRITYAQYKQILVPQIAPTFKVAATGKGIPASSGIAKGIAVFSAAAAVACKSPCILISRETTPDDIAGMHSSAGILTAIGGATSHAAVVARGMDKVCVVGCTDLTEVTTIKGKGWSLNGTTIMEGSQVTLNGATGEIWLDIDVPVVGAEGNPLAKELEAFAYSFGDFMPLLTKAEEVAATPACAFTTAYLKAGEVYQLTTDVLPHLTGLLDIRTESDTMMAENAMVNSLMGWGDNSIYTAVVTTLVQYVGDKSKFQVVASDKKSIEALRKAGYTVVETVKTMQDMLYATGNVVLKPAQGEAAFMARLMDIVDKSVHNIEPVYLGADTPMALCGNALAAVAPAQAVRRALNAHSS